MSKRVVFALAFVLAVASSAEAQWQSIAPNLIGTGPYQNSGAMTYSDGVAWAGLYNLYKSADKGLTWQKVTIPNAGSNNIHGITFYDKNTGIVCDEAGAYVTHDQGQTWQTYFNGNVFFHAAFSGSPNAFVIGSTTTPTSFTSDGGVTWSTHTFVRVAKDFYSVAPGKVIAFIESNTDSHIAYTSDYGVTWTERVGTMDPDSHSFGVVPCDENTIFGINEEGGNYASNNLSEIFMSKDGGASFTSIKQLSLATLSGCIAITPGAIYVPARSNGILQSIDNGVTWKTIAGPNVPIDSRDIITIEDTILLAADINGTIWRTINTAGAGQFSTSSSRVDMSSANVRNDTVGGTALVPIKFKRNGALSDVDFILHYDWYRGLTYVGSFLTSGKQIDVPGTQWNGHSQLHISSADMPVAGPELLGYARFRLYLSEGGCANAWMDSLKFAAPPSACFSYFSDSARSIICSNQSFDAVQVASNAATNAFSLSPNPSNGSTLLRSSTYSGPITVRIVNALGVTVQEIHHHIDTRTPIQMSLEGIPGGEYFIRLDGEHISQTLTLIRLR